MKISRGLLPAFAVLVTAMAAPPLRAQEHRLGPDDVVRMTVYGEKDLSGEYKVGGDGAIAVPLIGAVKVDGLTPAGAGEEVARKLADGYLVEPSVSVQVIESRPFYILGEVKNPGGYKYVSNMTVLGAVAMAGGFTYRARESRVTVKRGAEKMKLPAEEKILPGDIITVEERFF